MFSKFFDCIHAFGARENDDDEAWEGHHRFINDIPSANERFISYGMGCTDRIAASALSFDAKRLSELCYTFRYMAKNGRNSGSPWSLRQTGVYQKVDFRTGSTTWILLQPSTLAAKKFENIGTTFSPLPYVMHANLMLLSVAAKDWQEFVAYLHQSLRLLVWSRTGPSYL